MDDLISRRKAFEYFVTLWECIGTIMDRDEWEDVCMTTANEIPSAQPEPCEDAVSRRILLNDLKELITAWKKYPVMAEQIKGVETAIKYEEMIPSVTPKRKTGRWIEEQRGIKVTQFKCSECGRIVIDDTTYDVAEDYPFCHCGADMRCEQNE